MNKQQILALTIKHVRDTSKENAGHDWWHTYRVWQAALKISKQEKRVDLFIVQLGALLHDIADWKFSGGDETAGEKAAGIWLEKVGADWRTIDNVCDIVRNVSFKGAGVKDQMNTKEGQIVQDADRLDAIGAIGIARTFMYGGHKGKLIYDPNRKPEQHKKFEEYKNSNSPSINHFYEKLLLLKDRMHTKTARKLAARRDAYIKQYLKEFFEEWKGEA